MFHVKWKGLLFGLLIGCAPMVCQASEVSDDTVVYDVTDYQVIPDNGLDDTKEFQTVLDLAKGASSEVVIRVPEGVYDLSGTLDVYSNTHLILEDGAELVTTGGDIFRGAHVDEHGDVCDNRSDTCSHGDYTQTHDIILEGGVLRAKDRDASVSSGFIVFSHGKNITIKNMTIDGYCSHAIRFYGCQNVLVESCLIENNPYTEARRDGGAFESIQLGDNCSEASEGYPYPHDDSMTRDVVIRNCVFQNVITGIGNHGDCPMVENVLIEHCTFRDVGGQKGRSIIDGSGYGIDLTTMSQITIQHNTFDITEHGYGAICGTLWNRATSTGHIIRNNVIYSDGWYGITLECGAEAEIYENVITGRAGLTGIQVDSASKASAHHNLFLNVDRGVKLRGDRSEAYENVYENCVSGNADTR